MANKFDRKKTIKELENIAKDILKLKQERAQRRPLWIEFCGSPKSGKSTTITSLNIFLKRNGFNTVVLTERASICPINNKTHPFFNIWTMSSAIAEIIKHLDSGGIDIIISDRGIFDALCWFHWLNKNPSTLSPYLDNKAYIDLEKFILMDMWRDYLDLIYIFQVNPDTSIKREYSNLLTEKRGSIMTEQVLLGFNNSIQEILEKHGNKFRKIQHIVTDTAQTDDDPSSVGYFVTNEVLSNLKELLIEKIGYFSESLLNKLKVGINKIDIIEKEPIIFDNRDRVERSNYIQPIAIAVITNKKRTKVLVVKKGSKRTSLDSPERDRLLTYIGGHVRLEDKRENNIATLSQTLHREIQEEIGESINLQKNDAFIIYSPDNKISKKHIAICFVLEMDLEDKKFKLVSDEFIMKTGTSRSGHILEIRQITNGKDKIENWSRLILNKLFKTRFKLIESSENLIMFNDEDM